jgi:hypothetical protein
MAPVSSTRPPAAFCSPLGHSAWIGEPSICRVREPTRPPIDELIKLSDDERTEARAQSPVPRLAGIERERIFAADGRYEGAKT